MKEPEKNSILIYVILFQVFSALASQNIQDVPLTLDCNNEYECSTGSVNPFTVGKQYVYSYNLTSKIKVERVLSSDLNDNEQTGGRIITENGTLKISAINSCEFVATLELDHFHGVEAASLKVALRNGNIQRVCFPEPHTNLTRINTLKSMLSLLILPDTTSGKPVYEESIAVENGSKGSCLTKYNHCGENSETLVKYQSTNHCTPNHEESRLLANSRKVEDFHRVLSTFSKVSNLTCETIDFLPEALDIPKGLAICFVQRANGVVTSSKCAESLAVDKFTPIPLFSGEFYNSIAFELKEEVTKETPVISNKTKWVKTSIYQVNERKQSMQQKDFSPDEFRNAWANLIDAIKSQNESRSQINKVRSLLENNFEYEIVLESLNELSISSSSSRDLKIILMILATEANNENVMKVFQTVFANQILLSQLPKDSKEAIMSTILLTISSAEPVIELLQFSQFILSYVITNREDFSDATKLKTVTTYSSILNEFCIKMELLTGEKYCLKMSLIEESPVMKLARSAEDSFGKIMLLEAISSFQHHLYNDTTCLEIYEAQANSSLGLWSVLNCYRRRPCSLEGKRFYRNLIRDDSSRSNAKISAFLAMQRCFDSEDQELIRNLFNSSDKHDELLGFIQAYKINREAYGIDNPLLSIPEENGMITGTTRNSSYKPTRASNTFTLFELPYLRTKFQFETNILYFDKPTMMPEVITLSLYENQRHDVRSIVEMDFFINDLSNSEAGPLLNFKITTIVRGLDRAVYVREFHVSQDNLLHMIFTFQRAVRNFFIDNHASTLAKEKLRNFIMDTVNVDIFDLQSLSQGKALFPTVSGIPYELSWKVDGLTRLLITKNNCTGLFSQISEENASCHLSINPEVNIDGQLSLSMGSEHLIERKDVLQGSLNAMFPIRVDLIQNAGSMEESIKLSLPSMTTSLVRIQASFKELNGNTNPTRKHWSFGLGPNGIVDNTSLSNDGNMQFMEFTVSKYSKRNTLVAKVTDVNYELSLEGGMTQEYACNLKGNLTYFPESGVTKNYAVQVDFQNVEDSKKIQGKFINNGQEYSLDTYYLRQIKNRDIDLHHGFLSCGPRIGTGILCWWPFCEFCGTEYFIGVIINTPQFENVRLFEVEVTQIFPTKKINLVFKSEGIPILRKMLINVSLSHGNDTTIISNAKVRDTIIQKLKIGIEPYSSGDALPESESTGKPHSTSAYFLDAQFFSQLIGQSSASLALLSYLPHSYFTYESHVLSGEISYPTKKKEEQETLSYLSTLIYDEKMESNIPTGFTSDTSIRSSQFSVLNIDWTSRNQKLEPLGDKTVIVIRPLKLIRGEIKVEVVDYVSKNLQNYVSRLLSSWDNIHVNQTYKVYLPDSLSLKILKGKVALNRNDSVFHTAGISILVGVDDALELNYDFSPDQNNAFEILTSVTTVGETYGFFHRIEPAGKSQRLLHEGTGAEESNENPSHKYSGTYLFGEQTFKAKGTFQPRTGREILPFSKFNIRADSVGGKKVALRIFGAETVQQEKIHNMTMSVNMDNTSILEIINEINPSDETPIKANIFVKDFGELKISDSSKFINKRNLQVKAKWLPKRQLIQGEIAFPTSLAISPLYLDVSAAIVDETNNGNLLLKLTSESTMDILKNYNITTRNVLQLKDLKWEIGLESLYVDGIENENEQYNRLTNFSFSTHFIQPNLEKYSFEVLNEYYSDNSFKSYHKQNLKIQRPNVTPFQLFATVKDKEIYETLEQSEVEDLYCKRSAYINETFQLIVCHKDNFLYIFPNLNLDFNVIGQLEVNREDNTFTNGQESTNSVGKVLCRSTGANYVPLCNLLNTSFTLDSSYQDDFTAPWITNIVISNNLIDFNDELTMKLITTYETVKPVSVDADRLDDNIIFFFLTTVFGESVLRNIYNWEYQLQRKFKKSESDYMSTPIGVKGTYTFTKMFESMDFFEFTDNHKWRSISCGDIHIWTNLLNHTADSNQTSELATFSSQYVSWPGSASSNEGLSQNITWMELRTALNINGFGTLKSLVEQPSLILNSYEGDVEADFLVRTEFSPVKALRVTVSHKHSKSENEEDDSSNFDALTKLNTILNNVELSGDNSLSLSLGKLMALGNSFNGRFGTTDDNYEYLAIKAFALSSTAENGKENLVHFDVLSSWTNTDDDDTDLRIVNDIIYDSSLTAGLPLIRLAIVENSTDLDLERNISVLIYQSVAKDDAPEAGVSSRLPLNIMSENLDELSFTELSLQSVSQQIMDDYYNGTGGLGESTLDTSNGQLWHDYNVEVRYRFNVQGNSSNLISNVRWFGFEQKYFHCQSMVQRCYDNGPNVTNYLIDTSNYCNLLLFPIKHVVYLMV